MMTLPTNSNGSQIDSLLDHERHKPELQDLPVVFGTVQLDGVPGFLGLHHWALKIGETWREVGPGPDSNTGHINAASDPLQKKHSWGVQHNYQ